MNVGVFSIVQAFYLYFLEVGYKTILHLAIDEDDHDTLEYIDILLQVNYIPGALPELKFRSLD